MPLVTWHSQGSEDSEIGPYSSKDLVRNGPGEWGSRLLELEPTYSVPDGVFSNYARWREAARSVISSPGACAYRPILPAGPSSVWRGGANPQEGFWLWCLLCPPHPDLVGPGGF